MSSLISSLTKATLRTPLGNMTAIASQKGICALVFQEYSEPAFTKTWMKKYYPHSTFNKQSSTLLEKMEKWLEDYFSKNFAKLKFPPLDLQGSPLAKKAWTELLKIPVGQTSSYGKLAAKLGKPKASRAMGRIMGQNPIVLLVPCHRIIGADGSLTGYSSGGIQRKQWLLNHEGYGTMKDMGKVRTLSKLIC